MKKSIFLFFAAILCAIGMNAATWTVAGDKEIVNGTTAWKQDETKNDLTNVSGTKWGLLVENKTLSKKSYYFKITKDHAWTTAYPSSNYNFAIGAAGTYNIIYRFNTSGNSVGADYFKTWTVAGSGAVLTDDWTPGATANDMTRNGNTFEYVLTKKNVKLTAGTNYECKVCKDHAWGTEYPSKNKAFSVSTTGNYDVIFTFNVATTDVTVTTTPVYTITTSANPATAGTITGAGTYAKDAPVTLEATPNAGYKFVNWTVGGVEKSTDAKYSFTASADVTAVANFELSDPEVPTYAISVSANNDAMGTVTGAGDYTEGSPVTLTATPKTGYRFVNWTVGSEVKSTEATYSFIASEALTIVANFEAIPKYDITVKAVVPEAWTSTTIGIHYWGDGISGTSTPVATEKDGNWNKYTIKDVLEGQSVNVIFLNGTSWGSDKSKQTANIMDITEDKCFQISAKTLDGEGKCTVTEVDCAADIKPEGDVYTMMGVGELGLSWDLATTGNDMTKQTDGTYTLVKEGLDLATTGNYEYKVIKNHSWGWSVPSGNTNQKLTVDKDGTYTITFTLSADKKTLTADAKCTAEKEVILDCFVAGTTNLVGGTTDFTDELPMTYDEGTKTYSKIFTALAAGNYQMKVVYGSDWLGFDKLATPVPANVTEGDDKKIKFSLAEAGDVTVTYNVETGIGLVGTFAAPAPEAKKYYVKGTHNEWTADATSEMTLDGDVYKKEVTLAKDVEFKINDGASAWWGANNLGGKVYKELEATDNLKMKEAKTFTIIFNPSENLITFIGLTEETPVVEDLSKQPSVLYFHPSDQWKADDARFAAYFYGTEEKWVSMTDADKDGIYEVVNDKKNKFVIFCRMNPANNENKWGENSSHKWNQSADLEIPTTTYLNYWMVAADNTTWDNPEGKWMMLIGSGDNSEALTAADDQTVENVYVNRSFTAGQLYTIALPFDLSEALTKTHFGSTVSVIKFAQLNKDENDDLVLLFENALGMAAGKPYVITPSNTIDGFTVNNVVINNTPNNVQQTTTGAQVTMEAVLSASKGATTNGRYWLASDTYLYNVSSALKSLRAVFNIQSTKANVRARVAFGENVETGVDNIVTTDAPVKAIVNGQLIIIRDGVKYNVQGQVIR